MRFIWKSSAVAFATIGLIVGAAGAARAGERVTARVPFSFIVGGEHMPAGNYEVKELDNAGGVLEVQSVDGRHTAMVTTINGTPGRALGLQPTLTFEKFHNEYFLAGVATSEGADWEIRLTPKAMERMTGTDRAR